MKVNEDNQKEERGKATHTFLLDVKCAHTLQRALLRWVDAECYTPSARERRPYVGGINLVRR
jgi:hypothetical protein